MSESSMSHGRDCAVQEEKYPKTGLARKASRAQLRNAFSHIALICEDFCLQPYLSQVLLANGRTVSAEFHRRWTPLPGCNGNCGVESGRGSTIKSSPQSYERSARSCECAREGARPLDGWTRISVTSVSARLLRAATMTSRQ